MIHVDSGPSSDNSDKQSSEDCFEEKPLLKNEKPNPTHENEITDGPVNLYPGLLKWSIDHKIYITG